MPSTLSWLHQLAEKWFPARKCGSPRRGTRQLRPSFRPGLEQLEDRLAPAVFVYPGEDFSGQTLLLDTFNTGTTITLTQSGGILHVSLSGDYFYYSDYSGNHETSSWSFDVSQATGVEVDAGDGYGDTSENLTLDFGGGDFTTPINVGFETQIDNNVVFDGGSGSNTFESSVAIGASGSITQVGVGGITCTAAGASFSLSSNTGISLDNSGNRITDPITLDDYYSNVGISLTDSATTVTANFNYVVEFGGPGGDVTINAPGGDLILGGFLGDSSANVYLTAKGEITAAGFPTGFDLYAADLVVSAGDGISLTGGTGGFTKVQATDASANGINLSDVAPELTVSSISETGTGAIQLEDENATDQGTIDLAGPIVQGGGGIFLSSGKNLTDSGNVTLSGAVSLNFHGGIGTSSQPIPVEAGPLQAVSTNGDVYLDAVGPDPTLTSDLAAGQSVGAHTMDLTGGTFQLAADYLGNVPFNLVLSSEATLDLNGKAIGIATLSGAYFLGRVGFWRQTIFVRPVWSAGRGGRAARRALVGISLSPGFADSLHQVVARHDRTRARKRPRR